MVSVAKAMVKQRAQVLVKLKGQRDKSPVLLDMDYRPYPKADKAIQAKKAVALWAGYALRSRRVVIDTGTITPASPDGTGTIVVDGEELYIFAVVDKNPLPRPVSALYAAGVRS